MKKGFKHSEETRKNISLHHANLGKHLSEETKNKISLFHKGKKLSEEHKKKISLARGRSIRERGKGRKPCKERVKRENRGRNGFKLSEETKKKISTSCKNAIVVHHINGNHFDDRPENRMLLTVKEHAMIHIMQGDIKAYGGGSRKRCKEEIVKL